MGIAAKYYFFLLLCLFPPGLRPHLLLHFAGGQKSYYQCKQLQKMWLKEWKNGIRINFLPCFEFLFCEKHCPESHKVLQLPLVEAEHNLVVEGESGNWNWKPQDAECHQAPLSELALLYFLHHLFHAILSGKHLSLPLSLITIPIKSTFGMQYILLASRALNYRAGGVSVC